MPPRQLVRTEIVRPQIDPALLQCSDAPAVPGETATQRDVALYILPLWEAWQDCRGKLAAVGAALTTPAAGQGAP